MAALEVVQRYRDIEVQVRSGFRGSRTRSLGHTNT